MKSLTGRSFVNRAKLECDRYVAENINAIKYELFCEVVQDDFRQAEAMMLYALMLHGFGTKRLQRIHGWFKDVVDFPEILGRAPSAEDCMKLLTEKHGINFEEITVRYESREHYDKKEST